MEKTLVVYATKTGINEQAANAIADVLKTNYNAEVTVVDLKNGAPDIAPFQNVIVGGGVKDTSVYDEAVDFLAQDFTGKNVALYFSCEDWENPRIKSTEDNTKKVLAKNSSLKPIDVAAFGGCMLKQGTPVMDELNVDRAKEWAIKLGKMFSECPKMPVVEATAPEDAAGGFFEIHCDANGKFRFHLKAANGEIIAQSQAYKSKQSAENGIASVKKNAPMAKVVDQTTVPS